MTSEFSGAWQRLSDQFQALLDRPPVDADAVWRLFVGDAWYRQELRLAAQWLTRRQRFQTTAEDLCHEAMLVLRNRAVKRPDLGLNRMLADDHFGPWVRRVIRRHCLDALRRLGVRQRRCNALSAADAVTDRDLPHWRSELHEEIASLPPRERAVLDAYCATGALGETAQLLNMNYQRARRTFLSGIALLRERYEEPLTIFENLSTR